MRIDRILAAGLVLTLVNGLDADDAVQLVWKTGETTRDACGTVVTEAVDGGLLFQTFDGRLWTVTPQQLVDRSPAEDPCPPDAEALAEALQAEFGADFEVRIEPPYVLCSSAGEVFNDWALNLLSRLGDGFETYWRHFGLELHEPEFPLPIIIFGDRAAFEAYAEEDTGAPLHDAAGYYSVMSNRVALYDFTAATGPPQHRRELEQRIARHPFQVATVVHEATHQLAFNTGLQVRLADNPLWLSEGIAMFFETPDLSNRTGWRTIGQVHPGRLRPFQQSLRSRPADAFARLLSTDERLTNPETAAVAYAESWTLTHFLLSRKKRPMADYLRTIGDKRPLIWNTPEERLAEFEEAFGPAERLEAEFLRYARQLR